MPSVYIPVTSHVSSPASLRNPCPSGTGIGNLDINGTIFVICDTAFTSSSSSNELALGLGLGLGLGIPLLLILLGRCWCAYRNRNWQRAMEAEVKQISYKTGVSRRNLYVEDSNSTDVMSMLSRAALEDIRNGLMSPVTYRELQLLRLRVGEPLFDVANYAKVAGEEKTAERIIDIKQTNIPADVKQEFDTMKRMGGNAIHDKETYRERVEAGERAKLAAGVVAVSPVSMGGPIEV